MSIVLCPNCSRGGVSLRAHAIVAPWVAKLLGQVKIESELYSCPHCTLGFFSYRYSKEEAQKLYASYRTGEYLKVRRTWEPWYGRKENSMYFPEINQKNIDSRVYHLEKNLELAGVNRDFNGCVDFGGDLGQFFPKSVRGVKYIIDYSEISITNLEFTKVNNSNEIPASVELVMNCHVLEHISDLVGSIQEMSNMLKKSGVIYIEVPQDAFDTSNFHKSLYYKRYLAFLYNHKVIFIFLDFVTGIARQFTKRIPWFGIVKQSEHINYFNKQALEALCKNFHGTIWISDPNYYHKLGKFHIGVLSAVLSR